MINKNEEERYIQTKESVINNLYSQKETKKQYIEIMNDLLSYWINELKKVGSNDKERRNKLLELINREKIQLKKINEDIDKINKLIAKIEKR